MSKMMKCKSCSKEIASSAKSCPGCGAKNKKPFYKRGWFIVIVFFIIVAALSGGGNDSATTDNGIGQEVSKNQNTEKDIPVEEKKEENVPTEHKSALIKAKTYSDTMSMSKAGLYNQLTSDAGEKFPAEAAQYAIDNVQADWKENALKKAKTYQKSMAMSSSAIYDQLTSDAGEKFTQEEAQYAIDNLE